MAIETITLDSLRSTALSHLTQDQAFESIEAITDAQIFAALGTDETGERMEHLSNWDRYTTLASSTNVKMTPPLMVKWAAFAAELGKELGVPVYIDDYQNIVTDKPVRERMQAVARQVRGTLKADAREHFKAS